jgi:hypothetical protein
MKIDGCDCANKNNRCFVAGCRKKATAAVYTYARDLMAIGYCDKHATEWLGEPFASPGGRAAKILASRLALSEAGC